MTQMSRLVRRASGWLGWLALAICVHAEEAVWQWSAPTAQGRTFLWIPEDCARVRGVVVAQHNMIEEGILEHSTMRAALAELGFAEVFIAPPIDRVFDFARGAGERFEALMRALAEMSGYDELTRAPVVPMGHSACASFPWNFAAWNPERTLAVLSLKGDAPQTDLTGSGAPNPDWGERRIDGIPGLMVMSEQEWWEARIEPLFAFRETHPAVPLAVLADAGRGHFDASDELVRILAMFVRKAAERRMGTAGYTPRLAPIDPRAGWLVDRWREEEPPRAEAAHAGEYQGDSSQASWCFDEEHARATEAHQGASRGKKAQQLGFVQEGKLAPISTSHTGFELAFRPEADGLTFQLEGGFIVPLPPRRPVAAKDRPLPPAIVQPVRASLATHARGEVRVTRITGPVEQIGPEIFRVALNRIWATNDPRRHDVWLLASHPGNADYRGTVQQALLKVPPAREGTEQRIVFPRLHDVDSTVERVKLEATSTSGLPVRYFVREGPAVIDGDALRLTKIPPRAKRPVKVTVVAWQLGRATEPKVREAEPVERTFERR